MSWERVSTPKSFGSMGFKNLKAFNIAMIGKQAWKLVTSPNSLITKLLKAKYYPRSDYFGASVLVIIQVTCGEACGGLKIWCVAVFNGVSELEKVYLFGISPGWEIMNSSHL